MSLPAPANPASAGHAPVPSGDSYADLDRACHRFLMARDPFYRRTYEANATHRDARNARRAGKREPQPVTED